MASTASRPLILALDIGTSSTRALLYDAAGRLQPNREVQIKYQQSYTPDGGVQCDADQLLANTLAAVKRLLKSCTAQERKKIAAVGASCFWHGLMGIDAGGRAITPIYSWADTRARIELERLNSALDAKDYHRRTGAFVHSSYWPAKIIWLRNTQPHVADRVARWLSFSDYLTLRLCGRALTSLSMASGTGLLNEASGRWDEKTLDRISVDAESMPEIAAGGETFKIRTAGFLPELAERPWYPALGDGACSNIGAGGINDTRIVINISTSGAIRVLCPKPERAIPDGLFQYRMDKARYVIGGALSNGGNIYGWLARNLQLGDPKSLERKLAKAKPDDHGLTVLPFWAGERSPGWHAIASGSIVGLNLSTSAFEITQASMESIAYTFRTLRRDILSAFPVATQLIVSGGAVEHSKFLPRLLADVLNASVRMSLDPEPSGRGAALAVAEQVGALASIEKASDRLSRPISPNPDAAKVYDEAHARYETLYGELIGRPLDAPTAKTEAILKSS